MKFLREHHARAKNVFMMGGLLLLALVIRLMGIGWDGGMHLHPDERMLIMVTQRIEFFSQLNPDFFNYGSLPIYLLAGLGQLLNNLLSLPIDTYDGLLIPGRILSSIADTVTVFLIFLIGTSLSRRTKTGLLGAFVYAVAFFPIQNSHFFISDTFLTCFITLLTFLMIRYRMRPHRRLLIPIGVTIAAIVTTKVTGVLVGPAVLVALLPRRMSVLKWIGTYAGRMIIVGLTALSASFLFMPYAFLAFEQFFREITLQLQMNSNPYVFPYTLQYVGTVPYLYYLEHIIFWGMGPVISVFAIAGLIRFVFKIMHNVYARSGGIFHRIKQVVSHPAVPLVLLALVYFLVIGRSSVKFMRYMLPLYPVFALCAGYAMTHAAWWLGNRYGGTIARVGLLGMMGATIVWTLPFLSIYGDKTTRIQATEWITEHIPEGAIIAVEHWDDRIPMHDGGRYRFEELTLYDIPDNAYKWRIMEDKLQRSDYIVIASNRLYVPLMRLQECGEHGRCYPMTKKYYEELFAGKRGFRKIAEFTSYPRISFFSLQFELRDDRADESFTVYDHPKIMIFQRNELENSL